MFKTLVALLFCFSATCDAADKVETKKEPWYDKSNNPCIVEELKGIIDATSSPHATIYYKDIGAIISEIDIKTIKECVIKYLEGRVKSLSEEAEFTRSREYLLKEKLNQWRAQ